MRGVVKMYRQNRPGSSAQLFRREVGMPSGPPAEFEESSLIASIIIELGGVICHSHGWLHVKGKRLQGL